MKTCQQFYLELLDMVEKSTISTNDNSPNISTLAKTLHQTPPLKTKESYSTIKLPKVCFFNKDGKLDIDVVSIISIVSNLDDEATSTFKKRLGAFWRKKGTDITLKALLCMTGQAMPELPIELPIELPAMLDEIYKTLGPDDALARFKGNNSNGVNEIADDTLEQYFRSLLMDHVVAAMPEDVSAIKLYYSNVLYRKPANMFFPIKKRQQDIASVIRSLGNLKSAVKDNIAKLQEGYLLGTLNQLLPEGMQFIALMSLYFEKRRKIIPKYINVDTALLELSNYVIDLISAALKISDNNKRDQILEQMLLAQSPSKGPAQAIRLASQYGHATCISKLISAALTISDKNKRDHIIEQMLLVQEPGTSPAQAIRLAAQYGHATCISELISAALTISDNQKRDQIIEQMLLAEAPYAGPAQAIRLAAQNGHIACISELINAALKISDNQKRDQIIEQMLLAEYPGNGPAQAIRLASKNGHIACISELISAALKLSSLEKQVTVIQSILDLKDSNTLLESLIITPEMMTFFLSTQKSDGSYLLADIYLKSSKLYEKVILKACDEGKLTVCDLAYLLMPKQTSSTPMPNIDNLKKHITLRSKEAPFIMSDSDMQVVCIFLSLVKLRHDTGEKNNDALNTLLNFCLDNEVRAFEAQDKGCCTNNANLMPSFEQSFFLKKYKPHLRWREDCTPSREALVEALHQATMWGNGSGFSKVNSGLKDLQKAFPPLPEPAPSGL